MALIVKFENERVKEEKKERRTMMNESKSNLFMKIDKKGTLISGVNKRVVKIPKRVTTIGNRAFKDCERIEEVILPEDCISIEMCAFENCTSLKKINISGVHSLEAAAFKGCSSLEEIELPNLTEIPVSIFDGCHFLKKIIIPDRVEIIGMNAFSGCLSLEDVRIPKNILLIQNFAFSSCKLPPKIELPKIYGINMSAFKRSSVEEVLLSENLGFIGFNAFSESNLKRIVIPKSVSKIESSVFKDCKCLEEAVFECSMTKLEKDMFCGCPLLKRVVLPENMEVINDSAFKNCTSLNDIQISKNLKRIEENVFENCETLENLTIGSNIKYIGNDAFKNCPNLNLNIETSLFDFNYSHDIHHSYQMFKNFSVKSLTIYGKLVTTDPELIYDAINDIRRLELMDKFKTKLKELNVNLILDFVLEEYVEKIVNNFSRQFIHCYNYEEDFNNYLNKYIDNIKNIHIPNEMIGTNSNNSNESIKENQNTKNIEDENTKENTKNIEDTKFIQIIYNGKLCNVPLDFNILRYIEQQDDIEIKLKNNYVVREDEDNDNEKTFQINNALRRVYLNRLFILNISEDLREYLKRYDKDMEYVNITSVIDIKTIVDELAFIYYSEYTSKLNNVYLTEESLIKVRLDKRIIKKLK